MMIEIRNLTKMKIDAEILRKAARELFRKVGAKRPSLFVKRLGLSVVLVDPKRARELNKIYRKKTYVPNVLSFDYGEIVLCPEKIRQDAKKYGIVFERELVRIFSHGLMHLLGLSHAQMEKFEF